MRIYFILSLLPAAALCLSGCATHLDETRQMRSYWESGDYKAAALSAAEMANFSIDFDMKKDGSLDGYGNLFLDNFRIVKCG